MAYCKHCGTQIEDSAVVCASCGTSVADIAPEKAVEQKASFGWAVLGFFFPLVGLILWLVWKNDEPAKAKRAGKGALVGFIVNVVLSVVGTAFSAWIAALMFSAY